MPAIPPATPPDPYEHGFEATQRKREALSSGSGLPPEPVPPSLGKPPPRISWKWVLAGLVVVVVIGSVRHRDSSPSLKADCAHPAFALSSHSVKAHTSSLVQWSATGPSTDRFFLAIGAQRIDVTAQRITAVPPAGRHAQVASKLDTFGKSCLQHGAFGVLLPAGVYDIGLYRLDVGSSTQVARSTLTVTPGG